MGRTYRSEKSLRGRVTSVKRQPAEKAVKPQKYKKGEQLPYFNEETDGESFERFATKRPR